MTATTGVRVALGATLTLGVGLIVAAILLITHPPDESGPSDMNGNPVAAEVAEVTGMDVVENTGERFLVPSQGLDVRLGSLLEVNGQITPPGFDAAYLVRNRGVSPDDAATGTVFVVTHSARGGAVAPGNFLIDPSSGASRVMAGAEIEVGGTNYVVTGTRTVTKDELPDDTDTWREVPDRLVVITCLQKPDGSPSSDNVVIEAFRK